MLKRKYSEPPGQKCGTFRHHGRDFKLPQVNPAELTNVKPRKFVELLVNAQPPSALLDQSLDFYINFFDKALATTAFLHSLTKVNIDKLTQPSLHQRLVQQWKGDPYWHKDHHMFVRSLMRAARELPTGPRALLDEHRLARRYSETDDTSRPRQDVRDRPALGNSTTVLPSRQSSSMKIDGETFALPIFKSTTLSEISYSRFVNRFEESNPRHLTKLLGDDILLYAYKDWIFTYFGQAAKLVDKFEACRRIRVTVNYEVMDRYQRHLDELLRKHVAHQHGSPKGQSKSNGLDVKTPVVNLPSMQSEGKRLGNGKDLNVRIGAFPGNSLGNQIEKENVGHGQDIDTQIGAFPSDSPGSQPEKKMFGSGNDLNTHIRGPPGNSTSNRAEEEKVVHGRDLNARVGTSLVWKRGRSPTPENSGEVAPSPKRHRADACAEPVTTNPRIYSPSMAPMITPLPHNPNEIGMEIIRARSASVGSRCVAGNEEPAPPVLVKVESGADTNFAMTLPMHPPLMVRVKVLEDRQGTGLARIEALEKEHAKDQKEARSEKDILVERIASLERAQEKSLMAALTRIASLERELRGE